MEIENYTTTLAYNGRGLHYFIDNYTVTVKKSVNLLTKQYYFSIIKRIL